MENYINFAVFLSELKMVCQSIIYKVIIENKLENTYAYPDNITVGGHNKASHDKNLNNFLQAAAKRNLTFNQSRSVFAVS